LREFDIRGVPTTRDAVFEILGSDEFASGDYSTSFIDEAGAKLPALAGA
jgi:biotin carboxylase